MDSFDGRLEDDPPIDIGELFIRTAARLGVILLAGAFAWGLSTLLFDLFGVFTQDASVALLIGFLASTGILAYYGFQFLLSRLPD